MRDLIAVLIALVWIATQASNAFAGQTQYVILVTGDGIRPQEVFTGADAQLSLATNKALSGIESYDAFRAKFWRETPEERREVAMPFFWKTIAKQGMIFGNRALKSYVNNANPHKFSYPGYAEILNGQFLKEIESNDPVWSPRPTVLEFVRAEYKLPRNQVAAFGSWKIFNWITMQREDAIFCNAGYEAMPPDLLTPEMRVYDKLQFEALTPWDTVRHDFVTLGLALEYIKSQQPKFLYLALGETDDWSHNRRYDRVMESLNYFDDAIRKLWDQLQSTQKYRGKTTVIITTDHGRGPLMETWPNHGSKVPNADESWIAILGPDTPARGEMRDTPQYHQSNIATTITFLFGLDPAKFNPNAAPYISEAVSGRRTP